MNPSSTGWIHKFINEFPKNACWWFWAECPLLWKRSRKPVSYMGFPLKTVLKEPVSSLKLTKEELTKINPVSFLLLFYFKERASSTSWRCYWGKMVSFTKLLKRQTRFFQLLSFTKKPFENLENHQPTRLQESNNLIKKWSGIPVYVCVAFGDVLAFQYYLTHSKGFETLSGRFERTLILLVWRPLQIKEKPKNTIYWP